MLGSECETWQRGEERGDFSRVFLWISLDNNRTFLAREQQRRKTSKVIAPTSGQNERIVFT